MNDFTIVIVGTLQERAISAAFDDIADLLMLTFKSRGYDCKISHNQFSNTSVNIVLGYHLLPDAELVRRHRCIVYQLEQLPGQQQSWLMLNPLRKEILQAAEAVWDFSQDNIAYLGAHGLFGIKHVPMGFHPDMQRVPKCEQDIDILFYGAISKRRKIVLDQLGKSCKLKTLFGIYGARRDTIIARAKIVLNLHFGPTTILEQPRVAYLLTNRRFVVSETSSDDMYGDALVSAPYDEIADCCLRYLADPEARERMAESGLAAMQERPMTSYLANALA